MIYNKNTVLKFIHDALKPKLKNVLSILRHLIFNLLKLPCMHWYKVIFLALVLSNFICFNLATIYETPVQNKCVYILKFIGNRNVCGQINAR